MQALFNAIYAKLIAASSFATAVGGRVYYDHAPQNPTFPYCVYWVVVDTNDTQFKEEYPRVLIQFDMYDKPSNGSENTINAIKGYFESVLNNNTMLSVTGYSFIGMTKDFSIPYYDDKEEVYQWSVQFTMLLEKN